MQIKFPKLTKEILFFIVAGSLAVTLDYALYKITYGFLGIFFSKAFGFYMGVIVSFLINGSYTFQRQNKNFLSTSYFFRYLIVLTLSMFLNVIGNYLILNSFSFFKYVGLLGFLIATLISMTFNFVVLKLVVFK